MVVRHRNQQRIPAVKQGWIGLKSNAQKFSLGSMIDVSQSYSLFLRTLKKRMILYTKFSDDWTSFSISKGRLPRVQYFCWRKSPAKLCIFPPPCHSDKLGKKQRKGVPPRSNLQSGQKLLYRYKTFFYRFAQFPTGIFH